MGTVEIVSESGEPFASREEAGRLLGKHLGKLRGEAVVVLGIPRGGVVVAAALAKEMGAEMDVVLSRKLGAPGQPELAIGAVAEDGEEFVDERLANGTGATAGYVAREKERVMKEMERRAGVYRKVRRRVELAGKTVVVTDDGVATGATMQATLAAVRREKPRRLIAALPVGPEHTIRELGKFADRVVCLRAPEWFQAVGQFYEEFGQTEDDEVLRILEEEAGRHEGTAREEKR